MLCKLTKCCFCFPLKSGLIAFGYISLVVLYINIITIMCRMSDWIQGVKPADPISYIMLSLALGLDLIQLFFAIILLAGLHKGSCQLLEAYYECNVCMLVTNSVFVALFIPVQTYRTYSLLGHHVWITFLLSSLFGAVVIASQFYLTSLVKSHIRTLKRRENSIEIQV